MFGKNPEKQEIAAENRAFNFNREQNTFATGAQTDMYELQQQEHKSDLIKWQQEFDEELQNLAYLLTGWIKHEGQWYKDEAKTPLCNDKFMEDVVKPQCTPFLSRNLINSNFTEDRILMDLELTSNEIADNMSDGYDIYGIDFKNYDLVLRLIKNTIKASSFRALNGWTKKTDSTIFKRVESSFDNPQPERSRGFFGFGK